MALDKTYIERLWSGMAGAAKGGTLQAGQLDVARRVLVAEGLRCNPAGGRAAAVAEAAVVLRQMVGPAGRVKPPPASKKQKKAAKKAAKLAVKRSTQRAESLEARVDRGIREALAMTATQAPQPAPGTGLAPLASGEATLAGSFDAAATTLGGRRESPFWNPPGTGTAGTGRSGKAAPAAPGEAELAAMSADELRAHAAGAFSDFAATSGFGSPVWQ